MVSFNDVLTRRTVPNDATGLESKAVAVALPLEDDQGPERKPPFGSRPGDEAVPKVT